MAVSPDGKTLFVANADNNDVMVVDISGATLDDDAKKYAESISVVDGFIPVGWYPSALAVSPDNKTLFVANGKGLGSRSNAPAKEEPTGSARLRAYREDARRALSSIAKPDAKQMAAYTEQVRRNSPYTPDSFRRPR